MSPNKIERTASRLNALNTTSGNMAGPSDATTNGTGTQTGNTKETSEQYFAIHLVISNLPEINSINRSILKTLLHLPNYPIDNKEPPSEKGPEDPKKQDNNDASKEKEKSNVNGETEKQNEKSSSKDQLKEDNPEDHSQSKQPDKGKGPGRTR
ncbi:uncharacterized protein MELLADRAFT_65827 [Melampsora larici-populina 98AG31]|uniref:Uncharacterized protein n=1 Tax=Melampsora larici-populina (strain 98AG31 / pathotype 3-4-7) TaxID=747676 RepID=F4RWV1_MELLP|nr:uncharacterized protein MELLADRAFT_65827 [Melampsora larici-populina 98AG31]EGG03088.1 hypothetical protein MELLADRAFT_65827 [Melampsora larici-populina 98AG31]